MALHHVLHNGDAVLVCIVLYSLIFCMKLYCPERHEFAQILTFTKCVFVCYFNFLYIPVVKTYSTGPSSNKILVVKCILSKEVIVFSDG